MFLERFLFDIFKVDKPTEVKSAEIFFQTFKEVLNYPILIEYGHFNNILNALCTAQAVGLFRNCIGEFGNLKENLKSFLKSTENVFVKNMFNILVKNDYSPKKLIIRKIDEVKKKNALKIYLKQRLANIENLTCQDKIYLDLAITNYYRNEIMTEQYSDGFMKIIWSLNRPQFHSQILYRSNCSTIIKTIDFVLNENNSFRLNATAILNFLTQCYYLPRQFIGYQNDHKEDILCLNQSQIKKIIHYVVDEGDVKRRTNLVLRTCLCNDQQKEFILDYLSNWSDVSKMDFIQELYVRLYLLTPTNELNVKLPDKWVSLIRNSASYYDKILLNLVTSFCYPEPLTSYDSVRQFDYYEYALLNFAVKHPYLLLRYLSTISTILQSKVGVLNFDDFKKLNLFNIFQSLLNILNNLIPHIWKNSDGLIDLLNLYMKIFHSYKIGAFVNYELLPMLVEFFLFIKQWYCTDDKIAAKWFKENEKLFW